MTSSLYMLRCIERGLHISDLKSIPMGMVFDMITESYYDEHGYIRKATQADIDKYFPL